jgi:thiamine monophosphate synthase
MLPIPRGVWAVASALESVEQAQHWCRHAAHAAALSVRRCVGTDPQILNTLQVLTSHHPWCALHGRGDLAELVAAQAVIAGIRSLPVAAYRSRFPKLMVGASTHNKTEAQDAIAAGAHFLFYGPVWDTPEKHNILVPRGLHNLTEIVALGVPVIAIGGVQTAAQVMQVQATGAHGVAVLRAARSTPLLQQLLHAWE